MKDDMKAFVEGLEKKPIQGVELSPGIRKIRMAIKSKGGGQSGGARVITYNVLVSEQEGKIHLLEVYDKSEYTSVKEEVLKEIVKDLEL